LAGEAFARTADYDRAIADYFATEAAASPAEQELFPATTSLTFERQAVLRYGENPHQQAAVYREQGGAGSRVVNAEQLNGKELSYNNLLDLDAAWTIARSLPDCGVAVIKHNNPCGAASAESPGAAAAKAMAGDPLSAFGSIVGFNCEVDQTAAEALAAPGQFIEAVIAPKFSAEAMEILTTKPKWKNNVRLMQLGHEPAKPARLAYRLIDGGMLVQQSDCDPITTDPWQVVTEKQVDDALQAELAFAWLMVRHVKSNAIVLCKDQSLVGTGAGQMSRVDSVEIAIRKAAERSTGAVLASDAFFPFPDSIPKAAAAGVIALIQPGGSKNDQAVIDACNEHGLPMIFTGQRHFKH
jgi:phosphoribosylaminoimidazolecarboxamide formyltransferase/IMP cyclohydrolase